MLFVIDEFLWDHEQQLLVCNMPKLEKKLANTITIVGQKKQVRFYYHTDYFIINSISDISVKEPDGRIYKATGEDKHLIEDYPNLIVKIPYQRVK